MSWNGDLEINKSGTRQLNENLKISRKLNKNLRTSKNHKKTRNHKGVGVVLLSPPPTGSPTGSPWAGSSAKHPGPPSPTRDRGHQSRWRLGHHHSGRHGTKEKQREACSGKRNVHPCAIFRFFLSSSDFLMAFQVLIKLSRSAFVDF